MLSRLQIIVLLALALSSCSKDKSPTGPDTDNVAQYAGEWTGTTGQNLPVYFRINSTGEVDSLTIRLRMSLGLGTCTATFVKDTTVIVQGNSFSARVRFVGASFTTTVQATLGPASSATGTYNGYSGAFSLLCGSSFTIGTGFLLSSGTWSVTKTGP